MWSKTGVCISFPHFHISIKIPHEGNKGFIMQYKYYCPRITLKLSFIFLFPFTEDIYSSAHKPSFFWIRLLIKEPHTAFSLPRSSSSSRLYMSSWAPSALYDCVTDRLTLIVSPHPSVTLHQLSSDKPDQDKSPNKIWCPRPTKREKWESVSPSPAVSQPEKGECWNKISSCKWSEKKRKKKDALPEPLCGKGQSKHRPSVARQKKKRFSILAEKCSKALLQQFRRN